LTSRARSSRPIPSTSKADTQALIRRGDGLLLRAWLRRSIRRHLGAIRRRSSSLLDHPWLTDARRYLTPLLQLPDDWWSPYARFWLELVGGALALLAAAGLFGILAEEVATGDRVTLVDEVLVKWLYAHATPAVTRAMLVVTELGGSVVVASLTLGDGRPSRVDAPLALGPGRSSSSCPVARSSTSSSRSPSSVPAPSSTFRSSC
jgi:hypothetical protein